MKNTTIIINGIGVGIIMKNQLVKGKNGYAGEFGHSIIQIGGRPCPCGNHGCLEQYASERALFAELSEIKQMPIHADLFEDLYRQGDPEQVIVIGLEVDFGTLRHQSAVLQQLHGQLRAPAKDAVDVVVFFIVFLPFFVYYLG